MTRTCECDTDLPERQTWTTVLVRAADGRPATPVEVQT